MQKENAMRTSDELTRIGGCEHNVHASVSSSSPRAQRASAQKQVVMRMLQGEPIQDVQGEIDSILMSKGYVWENLEQRLMSLDLFAARAQKIARGFENKNVVMPADALAAAAEALGEENANMTVDYFGEEITAKPDFFVVDGNSVEVCKVTTSRMPASATEDTIRPDVYALGLIGEKLFPGKDVYVKRVHFAPSSSYADRAALTEPLDTLSSRSSQVTEVHFTEDVKEYFKDAHEKEDRSSCTAEECASCSRNNICNFEEPPISLDAQTAVRDLSEIRLTAAQRAVVSFESGKARVNAGAGAGKTLVVAMRIVELLEKGYEPEDIALLTFTKAGAEEMTARVMSYAATRNIALDPERFTSGTINGFCQDVINEHYEELGYARPPRVVSDETRYGIINKIISSFPKIEKWKYSAFSDSKFAKYASSSAIRSASKLFEDIKREKYELDTLPKEAYGLSDEEAASVFLMFAEFERVMKAASLIEFDDQIELVFKLAELRPSLFEEMGYRHILVDEFQDTDLKQIELLNRMMDNTRFKSFMAVGDDSQSIFAFRHTSPEFMINFGEYFGRFTDFSLVENHRSNAATIAFANAVNDKAVSKVDKDLIATKPEGNAPEVKGYYSKKEEYESVAAQIAERWAAGERSIAFLASDKNELQSMASELTKLGVPSVLMNPIPFAKNSRVAALCSFYSAFCGRSTQGFVDYRNVLEGGALKNASAAELEEIAESGREEVAGMERNLKTFLDFAEALDEGQVDECYQEFLDKVKWCQDMDELNEFFSNFEIYGQDTCFKREGRYEGVALTTIHSAKGLEWDTTFLTLSHMDKTAYHTNSRNFVQSGERDEVIRKFFVGATRARESLVVSGQYVLKMDKYGAVFNDYLRMAYDIVGKPFDYNYGNFIATRAAEKAEEAASKAQRAQAPVPSLSSMKGAARLPAYVPYSSAPPAAAKVSAVVPSAAPEVAEEEFVELG